MASRGELVQYAIEQAQAAGIDATIFVRMIEVESGFNPSAVSPAGAVGIAQIMPEYHPGVDPWDPFDSLRYAAGLLRSYRDRFGSYRLALAAYNAGPGAVEKYGDVPPYEETQRYIRLILGGQGADGQDSAAAQGAGLAGLLLLGIILYWFLR